MDAALKHVEQKRQRVVLCLLILCTDCRFILFLDPTFKSNADGVSLKHKTNARKCSKRLHAAFHQDHVETAVCPFSAAVFQPMRGSCQRHEQDAIASPEAVSPFSAPSQGVETGPNVHTHCLCRFLRPATGVTGAVSPSSSSSEDSRLSPACGETTLFFSASRSVPSS